MTLTAGTPDEIALRNPDGVTRYPFRRLFFVAVRR